MPSLHQVEQGLVVTFINNVFAGILLAYAWRRIKRHLPH